MKLKSIVSAVLAAGAMASANAFVLFPGLTQLEDDNREYLIKGAGNTSTSLQIGDRLRGVIKFQAIVQLDAPFASDNNISPEITGVFETEVVSITNVDANPAVAELIVFGPSASFQMQYGLGATVALYTGGTNLNINACPSIAACETAATDGPLWAVAGFGDADDIWVSLNSRLDFATVATTLGTSQVASINYAQTILVNNTGYTFNSIDLDCVSGGGLFPCAGDGKTDLIGSGSILGGRGLTNGYGARSDIDVTFSVVPEPGSLALVGLALAGIGLSARRRKA